MPRTHKEPIPLNRCHLYGIRSPHALAKRLGWELDKLRDLASSGGYSVYKQKRTGRLIQEPGKALQSVHRQLHKYLSRVETPSYLHSTVRGRSYVTNARAHVGATALVKIDIAKFYPSVRQFKVMHFFRDVLCCAEDVAGLLANLICFNGALATGSAASPIVSYYTYKSLFDGLNDLAIRDSLIMTCYVDDITFSGVGANGALLHEARTMIFRAGLRAHKDRQFQPAGHKLVTGVLVGAETIALPFSRWAKIQHAIQDLEASAAPIARLAKYPALISRLYEAAQVDGRCRARAVFYHQEWRQLKASLQSTH